MKRNASATWSGGLKDGRGKFSLGSGLVKDIGFGFRTRFEDEPGTNPEELIAAAHSGCFSMALAFALGAAGFTPTSIDTEATVTLSPVEGGFAISGIALKLNASVPGISKDQFDQIAAGAKANCPVSKALSAVPITLESTLT